MKEQNQCENTQNVKNQGQPINPCTMATDPKQLLREIIVFKRSEIFSLETLHNSLPTRLSEEQSVVLYNLFQTFK